MFSSVLWTSNHKIIRMQFGVIDHLQIFQRLQIAHAHNFAGLWKIYLCLFIPIALEIIWLPIQNMCDT